MRAERQAAYRRGRRGERLAALLLRLKGFRILARDFRAPGGEVDLIARRGRLLIFVEVKRRGDLQEAQRALQPRQRRRIATAARIFLARHPALAALDQRFDLIALGAGLPRHFPGAWRLDE